MGFRVARMCGEGRAIIIGAMLKVTFFTNGSSNFISSLNGGFSPSKEYFTQVPARKPRMAVDVAEPMTENIIISLA